MASFSANFVELEPSVQHEIISQTLHAGLRYCRRRFYGGILDIRLHKKLFH